MERGSTGGMDLADTGLPNERGGTLKNDRAFPQANIMHTTIGFGLLVAYRLLVV